MSLGVSDNLREAGSRITDARILRPRDELRLLGSFFMATVGLLDSHNPSAEGPSLAEIIGLVPPALPNHHHVLIQVDGTQEVLSTGMHVGSGEPQELLFGHVTHYQNADPDFCSRLRRLWMT